MLSTEDILQFIKEKELMRVYTNGKICDGPIKSNQWKNLYFTLDGKSYLGLSIWPTEEIAKHIAEEGDIDCIIKMEQGIDTLCECLNGVYAFSQYSHCLQIPWKE